jgi:hypothetical protein
VLVTVVPAAGGINAPADSTTYDIPPLTYEYTINIIALTVSFSIDLPSGV